MISLPQMQIKNLCKLDKNDIIYFLLSSMHITKTTQNQTEFWLNFVKFVAKKCLIFETLGFIELV